MDLCSNTSISLVLYPAVSLLVTHTTLCGCTAKPWAEQQLELSCKPVSTDPLEVWALGEWIHLMLQRWQRWPMLQGGCTLGVLLQLRPQLWLIFPFQL